MQEIFSSRKYVSAIGLSCVHVYRGVLRCGYCTQCSAYLIIFISNSNVGLGVSRGYGKAISCITNLEILGSA